MSPLPKKRLLIVLGVSIIAILAAVLATTHSSRERVVNGKPLQAWAIQAAAGDENAVRILRTLGPGAVPGLVKLLRIRDPWFRREAWQLAPRLPAPLRIRLIPRLGPLVAGNWRAAAAKCLGRLGPDAAPAVPDLLKALRDSDATVRWAAAQALGRIGSASVPGLIQTLEDRDPRTRHAAAYALGEAGAQAEPAIPELIAHLGDKDSDMRSSSAYSLNLIGYPDISSLSNVLEHGEAPARSVAVERLLRFYGALRSLTPSLIKMAHAEEPASRQQALSALGGLRAAEDAVITTYITALNDPEPQVRVAAIKALYNVFWRAEPAIPALLACLRDDSSTVREWSAKTLGQIGPPARAALPSLKELAQDPVPEVRAEARTASRRIAGNPDSSSIEH